MSADHADAPAALEGVDLRGLFDIAVAGDRLARRTGGTFELDIDKVAAFCGCPRSEAVAIRSRIRRAMDGAEAAIANALADPAPATSAPGVEAMAEALYETEGAEGEDLTGQWALMASCAAGGPFKEASEKIVRRYRALAAALRPAGETGADPDHRSAAPQRRAGAPEFVDGAAGAPGGSAAEGEDKHG